MSKGQKLYKKAKKIIPGGNQLLSKRPEMFLPNLWPSYYKKSKGIKVWDLNGKCYKDFSIMSIGQCPLGYAYKEINDSVKNAIDRGSTSTLNSYEEFLLAEKLISIHKGMDSVRFSKTGGEACAIAVRVARAYTNRSIIVASGYFGWHDWYLASNLKKGSLDKLLLPGLEPKGVPKELLGTCVTVDYGNTEQLKKVFKKYGKRIAAFIVEPQRNRTMNYEFLNEARKLTKKINSVLIYCEVSSGFRINTGGLYTNHKIIPDIVTLGKALGNGFPISAIMGNKDIMSAVQDSFISSSYWTERTGYVAGLKVIEVFQKRNIPKYLKKIGIYFDKKFTNMCNDLKINFKNRGLISVPIINYNSGDQLLDRRIKTYITQEMLKKNYLVSNVLYLSNAHNKKNIDDYFYEMHNLLFKIKNDLNHEFLIKKIKDEVCHSDFKRLT